MSEWNGLCSNGDCPCFAPDGFVCDEFKSDGRNYRCHECGWPEAIHAIRDQLADAGLLLIVGTERTA